jgi:hypothetical protein
LLDNIVDNSNPSCLHKINIVSKKIGDIPILAVLLPVLESDLERICAIEVKHLMAVATHKPLHLVIIPRKIKISECVLDIIVVIS